MAEKTKDFTKTKKYRSIRQDLLDQLERNGTCGEHYTDLVHDYMDLWVEKKLLAEDIRVRGVTVTYNTGGGQSGVKKNDSIQEKIRVSQQMLNILNALGIKPAQEADDDDEL